MTYSNPVIPGFYPDPSICRVGEDYYLVTSSFQYFPGVPIFHSRDLVHWRQIGYCLTRDSQLPLDHIYSSGGIYAPTLRYHQGTFYMVTTNVGHGGHFYVTAKNPAGPWSEPIWINEQGIDPSFFFDDDGKVYFHSTGVDDGKSDGIYQAEIDLETGELSGPRKLIWRGTGGQYPEAPHMYKINGHYYLLIAEGGTEFGHMVTIARGDTPWGPFESCPHNPVLSHRSTSKPIQATGHADMVQTPDGDWWMVFLGIRPVDRHWHHLGRETFLAPVTWTDDGWPVVGDQGRAELEMPAPALPTHTWPREAERDDFDSSYLGLSWNYLRNPQRENYSLDERPGWLKLQGSSATLDDVDSPTFVGRRQQHFNCQVATLIDFHPDQPTAEAGLTIFMDEKHHYEIAVTGQQRIIVRRRIGSLSMVVAEAPLPASPVVIQVDGCATHYTFSYHLPDQPPQVLATGETRYLSTGVAGGFTGIFFGLYATGPGRPTTSPAYFDWFEYKPA